MAPPATHSGRGGSAVDSGGYWRCIGGVFKSSGCLRLREKGEVESASAIAVAAAPETVASGAPH